MSGIKSGRDSLCKIKDNGRHAIRPSWVAKVPAADASTKRGNSRHQLERVTVERDLSNPKRARNFEVDLRSRELRT